MTTDHITCHACGGRIREREDNIVLSHRTDRTAQKLFFHFDLRGEGKCVESSRDTHRSRGAHKWKLTYRPYTWDPEEEVTHDTQWREGLCA